MWGRAGLVGATGFVGANLARQAPFARSYSSRDIADIAGETFDTVVCAGAPATMWQANADPRADRANLAALAGHLERARIGRLVLISTIAVYADAGAGCTEASGDFETIRPYGRHRRELEVRLSAAFDTTVIRLPALFGPGLKKNFVFDLINPLPSFVRDDRFREVLATLAPADRKAAEGAYAWDAGLGMHALDRAAPQEGLEAAFARAGFLARSFTNSESRFQYYDLTRLAGDLGTALNCGLASLNICSEPWAAGELHQALTGAAWANAGPPVVREDMRTLHAGAFGRTGPYLYSRAEVLDGLKAFVHRRRR